MICRCSVISTLHASALARGADRHCRRCHWHAAAGRAAGGLPAVKVALRTGTVAGRCPSGRHCQWQDQRQPAQAGAGLFRAPGPARRPQQDDAARRDAPSWGAPVERSRLWNTQPPMKSPSCVCARSTQTLAPFSACRHLLSCKADDAEASGCDNRARFDPRHSHHLELVRPRQDCCDCALL